MPSEQEYKSRLTFAGLIYLVSHDSKLLLRFLSLVAVLAVLLGLSVSFFVYFTLSGLVENRFDELEISAEHIRIASSGTQDRYDYFSLVHPHGLVNTGINVAKGDRIDVSASGGITIQIEGITDAVQRRIKIENDIRIRQEAKGGNFVLPEAGFSAEQVDSFQETVHPWTGPNGRPGTADPRIYSEGKLIRHRAERRLEPNANWGALLLTVCPSTGADLTIDQMRQDLTVIGDNHTLNAPRDGYICLIVNDYLDVPNFQVKTRFPYLYYANNLGFFMVSIAVTSRN